MSNIFYVSDYHFYHNLTIKRSRYDKFNNIDEMNEILIKNHNNKVNSTDEIYILGDIIVCDSNNLDEYMKNTVGRLKGNLHLILGNHDYKFKNEFNFTKYFKSIDNALVLKDNKKWVHLSHYPYLVWYRKNKGAIHIYGHLHNEKKAIESQILKVEQNAFNACVEITNYEPCTLDELKIIKETTIQT